jgi:ubiquinone/menaquinone biosynthesis C-methylase UbiE
MQENIDRANAEFWNELCGTGLAIHLGIKDHTAESLRRFDQFYFDYYPYLDGIVRPERMAGKAVLEIGLGYGTLGQRLAEAGAVYHGLDIAAKPVEMMNHRLRMLGRPQLARQGSALDMPFADESFDFLVSIGCFHHTGDTQRCFDETFRVLKPGGAAILMVYNKFAFRQWCNRPFATLGVGLSELLLGPRVRRVGSEIRREYDTNSQGQACPETALHSARQLRKMLGRFEDVRVVKRNFDDLIVKGKIWVKRETLLKLASAWLGLDLYFEARKPGRTATHAINRAA